jgi:hypothetical protein
MPGTVPAGRAEEDLELSARRVSRFLAAKVEEGDLDSLLELLENMLEEQERGEQGGRGTEARGPERGRRPRDVDPYFWG